MNNSFSIENSISSNQGEDSHRNSNTNSLFSTRNKFHDKKKISMDIRVYNKLINFLKLVVKELKIEDKEILMIEQFIQTESDNETNYFDIKNQIKYDEEIIEKVSNITQENENNHKNLLNLKSINKDLEEEIKKLKILVDDLNSEKQNLSKEMESIKNECEILKLNQQEKVYGELKNEIISENKILKNNENLINEIKITTENKIDNLILHNNQITKIISSFLHPKEFINFINTDKTIQQILNSKTKSKLKLAIENKNKKILNLESSYSDWMKDLEINDSEIERLMREYIQQNKLPGLDLKNLFLKAIIFLDREIKKPLGISTTNENIMVGEKKKKSIFGSFFDKIVKNDVTTNTNNSRKSMIQNQPQFDNLNDYDKFLVTENLTNNELNLDFDFSHPDEIKNLLVQFFTSLKNSPQTISNFISELINEFSDFLFYSQKTLLEIKELDIVKNALHERFRKYQKICFELETELEDLQRFARTNKEIKDILLKQKQEVEVKYTDTITQITVLKDELNKTSNRLMNTSEKYNRIEIEYENFKSKLIKEFKLLKNEYENVKLERNILKDAIFEFKRYFMRFHLTDDGDIAYVDNLEN